MRRTKIASIGLTAMLIAGCGKGGQVYNRPPDQVRDLLRTVEVPLYMFGSSADTESILDSSDPAKLVWKIKANDYSVLKFVATVEAEGADKTRVIVDVEGAKEGKFGNVEERLKKIPGVRNFYLVSMREAVDSTLDGRRYDITATYPAMMSAAMANANRMFPKNGPSDPDAHR